MAVKMALNTTMTNTVDPQAFYARSRRWGGVSL